jgi:hypothetical protein
MPLRTFQFATLKGAVEDWGAEIARPMESIEIAVTITPFIGHLWKQSTTAQRDESSAERCVVGRLRLPHLSVDALEREQLRVGAL